VSMISQHKTAGSRISARVAMGNVVLDRPAVETPQGSPTGSATADPQPVLGFMLLGGVHVGANVRDIRLANEYHRQGFKVHVWWMLDQPEKSELNPEIPQTLLVHGARYRLVGTPSEARERIGRLLNLAVPYKWRAAGIQRFPSELRAVIYGLIRRVCGGVDQDKRIVKRFAAQMDAAGITHMLPALELFCPFVEAARRVTRNPVKFGVTFQGYELYANYAREINLETELYAKLREIVDRSDFRAISVSDQYGERIIRDIGLRTNQLVTIPPPIEDPKVIPHEHAEALVQKHFPGFRADVPLVTFLGRQDAEKGIDLLLYAAKLCQDKGSEFQVLICGPTANGQTYNAACRQIAEHLRLNVMWGTFVTNELRSAIFQVSRCVVYPSIHAEPFGLVPVEACSFGTTALVPTNGGIPQEPKYAKLGIRWFEPLNTDHLARELAACIRTPATHGSTSITDLTAKSVAAKVLQNLLAGMPSDK
jgi:glycosyltransferase involved in cell wall biosynthesis